MSENANDRAEEIFIAALDRPPEQRAALIESACRDDPELRAVVESLLVDHEQLGDFMAPVDAGIGPPTSTPLEGQRVGHYVLQRVIASGGMGVVYEAVQDQPHRTVALKIMREGIASTSAIRRFKYESQILARLRHPHIAQVYEAGTHETAGRMIPYFAMEYVSGARTLLDYARGEGLDVRQRLELFTKVCGAVHHGHQRGIIHRDLKPSNILIDAGGEPKVIDFGVAKATDADLAVTTVQTDVGKLIGTLQYMSPEQFHADPHDLDTRSDVYALGVVLYELLCDRPPYELSDVVIHEVARIVGEQSPARPSSLDHALRGDIETITLKALQKDRTQRYQSVAELENDIRRYLNNEPIVARPPSLSYQVRLFARRYRSVFVIGSAAVLGLAAATAVSVAFAVRSNVAKRVADERNDELQWQLYVTNIAAADAALRDHARARARERLDAAPAEFRNWEWNHLAARAQPRSLVVLEGHAGDILAVDYSPDGTRLASASIDRLWDDARLVTGTIRIWNAMTGEPLEVFGANGPAPHCLVFAPDGTRVAAGYIREPKVILWDVAGGEQLAEWPVDDPGPQPWVRAIDYDPRGGRIVVATDTGKVTVWDVESHEKLRLLSSPPRRVIHGVAYSRDGTRIAATSGRRELPSGDRRFGAEVWDSSTFELVAEFIGHDKAVSSVAFSGDGRTLATGAWDRTVRLWDIETGREVRTLQHEESLCSVAFSPDGSLLATSTFGGVIRLWDPATGHRIEALHGHQGQVFRVVFSPDGTHLASSSIDKTVRVWDVSGGESESESADAVLVLKHGGRVTGGAFSTDGSRIASVGVDDSVRIWDSDTGDLLVASPSPGPSRGDLGHPRNTATFAPDDTRIAVGRGPLVRVLDARTGDELAAVEGHNRSVFAVAYSPTGHVLASGGMDEPGPIILWDPQTCERIGALDGHEYWVASLEFSRDGRFLASASWDFTARLWDVQSREELAEFRHDINVTAVALNPNASLLVSGSKGGVIAFWDVASKECIQTIPAHQGQVVELAFSPDGSRIASASRDRTVKLWDAATREELLTLRGHTDWVFSAEFSPDGHRLLTTSWDGTVRVWDVVSRGEKRKRQAGAVDEVTRAAPVVDPPGAPRPAESE